MKLFFQTQAFINKKIELKNLAYTIKSLKIEMRLAQRNGEPVNRFLRDINSYRQQFRHDNIAYCLVKGRNRESIETPKHNLPDEEWIRNSFNQLNKLICKEIEEDTKANEKESANVIG